MLNRLFLAAITAAFLTAATIPSYQAFAQTKAEETKTKAKKKEKSDAPAAAADTKEKKKAKRPLSAKQKASQARFTNCARVEWAAHKKATGAKGQKAYRAFMSDCLKKKS